MNIKIIVPLFVVLFLVGCDFVDNKFRVINNSSNVISFYFTKDSTGEFAREYYGSFYYNAPDGKVPKDFRYLKQGDSGRIESLGSWETDTFQFNGNGIAYIYVIDSINVGKDTSTLLRENLIRKHPVTMEYLNTHNWMVGVN